MALSDFNTLKLACQANDLICDLVMHGDHHDYLAKFSQNLEIKLILCSSKYL